LGFLRNKVLEVSWNQGLDGVKDFKDQVFKVSWNQGFWFKKFQRFLDSSF
jgi:hypothetical protein